MRIQRLHLENFRNIGLQRLEFSGRCQFFLGPNGQGKTNMLEAIHYITALKSFRVSTIQPLIKEGTARAQIYAEVDDSKIHIQLMPGKKGLEVNGEKVKRAADYIGQFPTVVLSADDMLLLRGSPSNRRKYLDETLASVDGEYYLALKHYTKVLAERNALLKSGDLRLLDPYDGLLAKHGEYLISARDRAIPELFKYLEEAYTKIATEDEVPQVRYSRNVEAEGYLEKLKENRQRDGIIKSTQLGPHRDDLSIELLAKEAKLYGSEGQQRGLTIALRLAQFEYFRAKTGKLPVLLADDVLGQLDPQRAENFWDSIDPETQVIGTGTEMPRGGHEWEVFNMDTGVAV